MKPPQISTLVCDIASALVGEEISAVTIWPWIFCRRPLVQFSKLYNHKALHLTQQKECLLIGFYLIYIFHFFWNLILHRDTPYLAYKNICFEREAEEHENFPYYRIVRHPYDWRFYLCRREQKNT